MWTATMERAALLVWLDQQTDAQIAADLGIGRRTLTRWKATSAFVARMEAFWRQHREVSDRLAREEQVRRHAEYRRQAAEAERRREERRQQLADALPRCGAMRRDGTVCVAVVRYDGLRCQHHARQ